MMREIRIGSGGFAAHLARPKAGPTGVVLLLHEIFGVNRHLRATAEWIAGLGYHALCPDLFWRQQPGVELDPDGGMPQWERAFALMRGLDEEGALGDLQATLAAARGMEGANGRVAVLGHCLGGRLALRLAARSDVDAAISYYGVGIDELLEEAAAISAPLLLHLAGRDKFVPPAAQRRIEEGFARHPLAEVMLHPEAGHAFARMGARSWEPDAAAAANAPSAALLARVLG